MAEGTESAERSIPRRQFLKGLGAAGAAFIVGGSSMATSEPAYVGDEIDALMNAATDAAADTNVSGSDKTKIYLGHPNDYGFWGAYGNPAKSTTITAIIEEGELDVDLVYLEEDINEDEFQRRRRQEFRNYVENLDTFFGMADDEKELLYDIAGALEAATYPEEEFRDRASYMLDQLAEAVPDRPPYRDHVAEIIDDFADWLHVDAEEYRIPDASLEEIRATVEGQYQDLLDSYDVDVNVDVRRISEAELAEQGYDVADVIPPNSGDKWRSFRTDFGYDGGILPVMLSTRDIGYALDGLGTREQAFVHIPVDMLVRRDSLDDWALGRMVKQYLVTHEVGHAALHLPHNATRDGVMSYNKMERTKEWLLGDGPELTDWSETLCERLITQDNIPEERADELTVGHMSVFLHDMMDFAAVTAADTASYVQEDDVVRYVWEFDDGHWTELDVAASGFFDRLTARTYRDGELMDRQERTF